MENIQASATFKVVCPLIDTILLVKAFNVDELKIIYGNVKTKLRELKKPIKLSAFADFIVKKFLHNSEEFYDKLPSGEDNLDGRLNIIYNVFMSIVDIYSMFRIDKICEDINNENYLRLTLPKNNVIDEDLLEEKEIEVKGLKNLDDIVRIQKFLSKKVIGQTEAIEALVNGMKLVVAGLKDRSSFFFLGKTGVGKTLAAKLFGSRYSGNFFKINCAEFTNTHELNKLLGSPPGYIGSNDKSTLREKADKSNKWVFLWDEIEKANSRLFDLLLGILDEGKITDNLGKELDFSKSIHIFTSNIGVKDIKTKTVGFNPKLQTWENSQEEIAAEIKRQFSPEFINRIDTFVYFNSLTIPDVEKIVLLQLKTLPVVKDKVLIDYIVKNAYSEEYGAREVERFITKKLATIVADAILNKKVPIEGRYYQTAVVDNTVSLINLKDYTKNQLEIKTKL